MNPVAKNLNKFNKPATHKDKKQAEKRGEQKHKGKIMQFEADRDSGSDLAKIGRILMDKAITQKDEKLSGIMSTVGNELTAFGTNTGARTPEQLEDRTGVSLEIIDQLVDYAKKFSDDPAVKAQDTEDMLDGEEDNEFADDDEDKIIDVGDADEDEEPKEGLDEGSKYQDGIAVIQMLEAIVRDKSAKAVPFMDGKGKVDMFTASAVTKVFDALNEENKRKVLNMIGTRTGFLKIAKFAMEQVGRTESMGEGHNDYDPGDDGDYAEREMAEGQLEFIKYACDELKEHFQQFPMPEWFQNKLSGAHETMTKLHAYIEGKEGKYGLNDDLDESGLQYYTGKKKYGKEGMAALAKAGRDGASEEELGRIKDKYKKTKEELDLEEDSKFDRNFSKRIGYTVKGGAASDMMKKQADQIKQTNKDLDPGADKKGLGIGVLDTAKARKKAKEKGVKAPGSLRASPNTRNPDRLPENCSDCGKPVFVTMPENIQATYENINEEKQKGIDGKVCWKGYKRMGTKMKGGKRVDNCVKIKK